MRINAVKCNNCSEEKHIDQFVIGSLPNDWYALTKGNGIVGWELHFCSLDCLEQWAKMQIQANTVITPAFTEAGIAGFYVNTPSNTKVTVDPPAQQKKINVFEWRDRNEQ